MSEQPIVLRATDVLEPNIVTLTYTVPVVVDVNIVTGQVVRVVVVDEAVQASSTPADADTDADATRAWAIVESADWPSWSIGS